MNEQIRLILTPIDGSDCSLRAAELGIRFAKFFGAKIVAIYVIDNLVLEEITKISERRTIEQELREKAQHHLNYVTRLAEKEKVEAETMLLTGEPYSEIVYHAEALKADLISVGTHGRRGAERILLGSVAERVIEYSPCPVIVVH